MADHRGLVILQAEQLRQLAKLIYYQESRSIYNLKFQSESERAKYLTDCKSSFTAVLSLLDRAGELKQRLRVDQMLATPANEIFEYLVACVNSALQTVRNYSLRMNYLGKISEQADGLIAALKELKAAEEVASLAEEVFEYRTCMLEYIRNHRSTASRSFSKWIKDSGITFNGLVQMYQNNLGFGGLFKNLKDEHKIKVYAKIIQASGRGALKLIKRTKILGVYGFSVLLMTFGMMVWDIFSSEIPFQKAIHDVVFITASAGGAIVGQVVGAALSTKLLVSIGASPFFLIMGGIITGFVGAFILGSFVGFLVDLIFGSGGDAPLSTDGHRCYVAPMPDGEVLARQIAHRQLTN